MISINISENEIINSSKTNEMYKYLLSKGHKNISLVEESKDGTKAKLAASIAIASLLVGSYPIIKDLQNWARPKNYSITVSDNDISGTVNNLTKEEYISLLEKLNQDEIKIEIK